MSWIKKGLVYSPNRKYWWNQTHAFCPTPYFFGDRIRIYYASWDKHQMGRISFIDVDPDDPSKVIYEHNNFILDIGEPGTFDCDGLAPSCVIKDPFGSKLYMYYFAYQRTERHGVHLILAGLAESWDGKNFEKLHDVPLLDRTQKEKFIRSTCSVMYDEGVFKIWYTGSLSGWKKSESETFSKGVYPTYSTSYMISPYPDKFCGESRNIIELKDDEFGISRPVVIKENNMYKMWHSIRSWSKNYRMGYAESKNGVGWVRKDSAVGIDVSNSGWDSEMICFGYVIRVLDKKYMFYNGNKHGEDGFGLAVLEE